MSEPAERLGRVSQCSDSCYVSVVIDSSPVWRRSLLACAIALVAAAFSPAVRASTLIALELSELVSASDYIVVANAQSESSRYVDKLIVTDVTLRVITSLKGSAQPGSTLIATHLGGAVDRVGLRVPGAAHFTLGHSAIVFLRRADGSRDLNVTGMSQGVMPIAGSGDAAMVQPPAAERGATVIQRVPGGGLVEKPASAAAPRKLADVIAEIEALTRAH